MKPPPDTEVGAPVAPGVLEAWVMASRPKTLAAAVAPVWVGIAFALARGVFRPLPAAAALVGAVLIQIGTNLANDYHDFVRGSDTEERVGPTRVTQAGILAPKTVLRGTVVVFGLAVLVGGYLVWVGGWPILVVGLASIAAGVAYTAGPFPLGYHGLGDPFVLVFFGPVAVGGTYWVQGLELPAELILPGLAMGALVTNILVANNLRDLDSDARVGKRTLAVRLGRSGTRFEYALLLMLALATPLLGIVAFGWTAWSLLALATLIPAFGPLRTVFVQDDPQKLRPALGGTARVALVYGVLLGVGIMLG